jgi:hypothetical protein
MTCSDDDTRLILVLTGLAFSLAVALLVRLGKERGE